MPARTRLVVVPAVVFPRRVRAGGRAYPSWQTRFGLVRGAAGVLCSAAGFSLPRHNPRESCRVRRGVRLARRRRRRRPIRARAPLDYLAARHGSARAGGTERIRVPDRP